MVADPITSEDPEKAVREWFERFGEYVAKVEYDEATDLVADDVASFGTKADIVEGRDALVENQWTEIWPSIEEFAFEEITASGNDDQAWGAATWSSTGFDENGEPFHRPGRATIAFERRDGRWLAVHTHFSLYRDTPRYTYGPDGKLE